MAASSSPQFMPAPKRPVRASTSISACFIGPVSITIPSSQLECPAVECPPPRTATTRSFSRAYASAACTSPVLAQRAISAGRLSIAPLKSLRASS